MAEHGKEKIALVLQGGGALGSYQAGAYEALMRLGYDPNWIAGISIGAINAAIICGNPPERRVGRLKTFWESVSGQLLAKPVTDEVSFRRIFNEASAVFTAAFGAPGFFRPRLPPPALTWPMAPTEVGFYDTTPLRDTLLSLVDFDLLNSGTTRVSVGAVNIKTGNFRYFDSKNERIEPEHIMASGALPPGFPPVEINGEFYWDGGLVSNTPLEYILDWAGPRKDMCVFQIDLFSARGLLPATLLDIGQREKEIRYSSRTRMNTNKFCDMQNMRRAVHRLKDKLPEEVKNDPSWRFLEQMSCDAAITIVQLIHRRAAYETDSNDYEFSRYTMNENWRAGRLDVENTLSHPAWINRDRSALGVHVLDLTKDLDRAP